MPPTRYPEAVWRGDGQSGGSWTGFPYRVILHTTETRTIPGYNNGASAPHLTYFPAGNYWVQHTSFATAARALRNLSGGVQTNRQGALQVEIVCYSAKSIGDSVNGLWVGNLTETHLRSLARFLNWVKGEFDIQLTWPGKQALSYAQANATGFRMTASQWDGFNGVAAHQHVPENLHWDTGALDWNRLMSYTNDAMELTDEEIAQLRGILAALKAENSNPDALRYLIRLIRTLRKMDDIFDTEEF